MKYLVDFCDIQDISKISQIPKPLIHLGLHSGKVILDEDDPQLSRLALMGFKVIRLDEVNIDKPE
jgi:hypothetical protein